jgi:L-alanine-DL-glutamate epimerase-like enolase superfamily enzyme
VTSAYTISLDTPDAMAAQAAEHRHYPLLKLKVTGDGDLERVRAIRAAAPEPALLVDANEAWRPEQLAAFDAEMGALGVVAIEQPLPAGQDDALLAHQGQVPLCADESCHTTADLPFLLGKYQMVNIKLDKAGGLTSALELLAGARSQGFSVMVGCMVGTSLAMAPAMLLAADAQVVDLDGPWLLAEDRAPSLLDQDMRLAAIDPALWG